MKLSSSTLRFRLDEVGLDSAILENGPSSESRGIGASFVPSGNSGLTTFDDPPAAEALSATACPVLEMGTLTEELTFEPEVDRGPRDGKGALDKAAEMDAAGGRMLSFFVTLDFGFFGGALRKR